MRLRSWLWMHRWIGIALGVPLAFWLASGVVMLIPLPNSFYQGQGTGGIPPLATYDVSPMEAGTRAKALTGKHPTGVTFERLRNDFVYVVSFADRGPLLLDGTDGNPVTITMALAERISRDHLPAGVPLVRVDTVTHHSTAYANGPLPAFRLVFRDRPRTIVYVGLETGAVRRTTRMSRLQTWVAEWHLLTPLTYGGGGQALRSGILWTVGLGILVSVLAGSILVLPRRWFRSERHASR